MYAIDYNPATKLLATGSVGGQVRIWNTHEKDAAKMNVVTFFAAPGLQTVADTAQTSGE